MWALKTFSLYEVNCVDVYDITKIENYRRIVLLALLYKLFTKIITNRLTSKLDRYEPVEQVGLRKRYRTKKTEYQDSLHFVFTDLSWRYTM